MLVIFPVEFIEVTLIVSPVILGEINVPDTVAVILEISSELSVIALTDPVSISETITSVDSTSLTFRVNPLPNTLGLFASIVIKLVPPSPAWSIVDDKQ